MVKRSLLAVLLATFGVSTALAESYSIPSGTTVHCRVTQTLTTGLNHQGDSFTAAVSEPVVMDGRDVVPVGSTIEGRIAQLAKPGRVKGVGEMRLLAERIAFPDGKSYPVNALLVSTYGASGARVVGQEGQMKGPSSRRKTFGEIGGLAAGGGLAGLIFSHPVLGLTVGGAAGFVDRARKRGKDLILPSGTQLNYQLTRALEIQR